MQEQERKQVFLTAKVEVFSTLS